VAQVERLLYQHRPHRPRHRRVGEPALHVELVLAHHVDHRREHGVVQEVLHLHVERVQHVRAGLHVQQFLDHLVGHIAHAHPLPRRVVLEYPKHLVRVTQFLRHDEIKKGK